MILKPPKKLQTHASSVEQEKNLLEKYMKENHLTKSEDDSDVNCNVLEYDEANKEYGGYHNQKNKFNSELS